MIRRTLTMFALSTALAACTSGEPAKPIKDYMAQDVQPTAEIYWNAVQFISDESGDHDIEPQTDAEWADVAQAAARLGEIGKELKDPAYSDTRGSGWNDFADGLIKISADAEAAAKAKDPDKVFEVGGTMYSVCSACHEAYPAETPETGADATSTG
ncbi:hypothetical protein GRI89_05145 [Altererythrobacter salegens]|uniref:Cytochrome c n=1 Tax=Croceibacterium salegens TaxID=1737568 RepID=A0A6I4SSR5_9SPHN|nr:hypothetical protein [Croceibacterium salegens]MXO58923.1 hypothetical protein [Croceibacterium salegens]